MTEQNIINNIKSVFNHKDINKLNKTGYNYLYLRSGFIAHYDINGFKGHYEDLRLLFIDILSSDADSDIKILIKNFEKEIKDYFEGLERRKDLRHIKFLMKKHELKEVTQETLFLI